MSNYKIEKNVPMVDAGTRNNSYPFRSMKVGDSFTAPIADVLRLRPAASYFAKRNPAFRFSIKRQGDVMRAWRVPVKDSPQTTQKD